MSPFERCPCGSGDALDSCCAPLHRDERVAVTAAQVMRARYSAYATHDETYLRRSWATTERPRTVGFEPTLVWTGLSITATSAGTMLDDEGTVSFEAHHERDGRSGVLRETSRFVREAGSWVYAGPAGP